MQISIGKVIKRKEDYDNANIICPIKNYHRDKYLNRRLFIRVLFMLLYGFGLGYSIFYNTSTIDEVKIYLSTALLMYILLFYLIQIPHELLHAIFFILPLKNTKNKLLFLNKKRLLSSELLNPTKWYTLFFSLIMPFILFTVIPLYLIYFNGFNINLFILSFANAILSSEDILNIFLLIFSKSNNGLKSLYVIPNNYDYIYNRKDNFTENVSESTSITEVISKDSNNNY